MNKLIGLYFVLVATVAYGARPAPAVNPLHKQRGFLQLAYERIPACYHGPERCMRIHKVYKSWRNGAKSMMPACTFDFVSPAELQCICTTHGDVCKLLDDPLHERIEYAAYASFIAFTDRNATRLPEQFFVTLPESCWTHLDLSQANALTKDVLDRVVDAWMEAKREPRNIQLPKSMLAAVQGMKQKLDNSTDQKS